MRDSKTLTQKSMATGAALALWASIASCGLSPLLNHKKEAAKENTPASGTGARSDQAGCALKWQLTESRTVCAAVQWMDGPSVGENKMTLRFDQDASDLDAEVVPWMPDMGHGTAPVKQTWLDPRTLEVSEISLFMGGLWVIYLRLNAVEQSLEVPL